MANEIQGSSQEVPQSLKTAEKKPLDGRIRFATMAEAVAEAYEGATFYVAENGGEWYKFKLNAQGVLVAMADSSIDASQFALKSDLNGLATSVVASAQNDGLMKAADYLKLTNIDPTRITKVRASATNGNLLINDVETTVYARKNTPEDRPVTDTEKETWNGKAEALHYHATLYAPLSHNHNTLYAPLAHEHQVWDNALGRYREKYVLADSAGSGGNATTLGGLSLNNNATGVGADDAVWSATKVKEVVDAKANEMALGNSWKPAVATFADIATTYPNPQDGWTVPVKDIDHSWRFNGTEWVDLGGVMPLATQSVDGKMSASDKAKLDGIAAGANNYTHPLSHLASMITEEIDKHFLTDAERLKVADFDRISGAAIIADGVQPGTPISYTGKKFFVEFLVNTNVGISSGSGYKTGIILTFPKSEATYNGYQVFYTAMGTVYKRMASSSTAWGVWSIFYDSSNLAEATQAAQGLLSAADKAKIDGIAASANNYVHPATHPASIIIEEVDKHFLTDAERTKLANALTDGAYGLGGYVTLYDIDLNGISAYGSGFYYAMACEGMPTASNGWLLQQTIGADYCTQTFVSAADGLHWTRSKLDGVWSVWARVYDSQSLGTASMTTNGLMSAGDKAKLDGIDKAKLDSITPSNYAKTSNGAWVDVPDFYASDLFELNNRPGVFFSEATSGASNKPSNNHGAFLQFSDPPGNDVKVLHFVDATTKYWYYAIQWGTGKMSPWKMVYTPDNIPVSSQSASGLMSAADKSKLDGVATGATKNKTTVSATMPANPSIGDIWIIP